LTRLLLGIGAVALLVLGFAAGALVHVGVNSLWIPVVAALGASLLTGIFGFGGEALRDRRSGAIEAERRRRDAYVEFLIAANGQIATLTTVRELRKLGTGLKPVVTIDDPVAFLQQFNRESMLVFAAWTRVWLHGSQDAITISNRFVDAVIPATGAATAMGKARPLLLSRLLGEAWTKEQENEYADALRNLGRIRIEFAKAARKELREADVEMLAGIPKGDEAKPAPS
jgi:hypothetical protein